MCVFVCFFPSRCQVNSAPLCLRHRPFLLPSQAIKSSEFSQLAFKLSVAEQREEQYISGTASEEIFSNLQRDFLKFTFIWIFLPVFFGKDDVYHFQHGVRFLLPLQHRFPIRGHRGILSLPGRILLQHGISPVSGMSSSCLFNFYYNVAYLFACKLDKYNSS